MGGKISKYNIVINCGHKTIYSLKCPKKKLEMAMDIYMKNIKDVFGENEHYKKAYYTSFEFSALKASFQIEHYELTRSPSELNVLLMRAVDKSITEINENIISQFKWIQ